jgi:hypothetical protein
MSKCRKLTGCHHDKTDKACCDDCRKKKTACSKACEGECKNVSLCDTCTKDIAECEATYSEVEYGVSDNVIKCKYYLKVEGNDEKGR